VAYGEVESTGIKEPNCDCPVGLFDFRDYPDLIATLSQVLNTPADIIHERLFHEALEPGWNVAEAVRKFQATPHVYDKKMEAVYSQSDAFVYACAAVHLTSYCQEVDRRVTDAVGKRFPNRGNLRILAFGDGIGTDALRFAAMGHDVTYFEFEGFSSVLAAHRFCRLNLESRTRILHSPEDIPLEEFDVVICREVLEHVVNPPSLIASLRGYLRDSGIAIITESFDRVEPSLPTHLAENRKYAGETERIFVKIGFRLLCSYPDKRPMVFQKTLDSDHLRFRSLRRDRSEVIHDSIRRVGRQLLRLVRF